MDPRVDAYIEASPEYAQPILRQLRRVVHEGCPAVEESIKWSRPAFSYDGKLLWIMSAFKEHCAFDVCDSEIREAVAASATRSAGAMGVLGRIASVEDLPPQADLVDCIRKAAEMRKAGVCAVRSRGATPKPEIEAPLEFLAALEANSTAKSTFNRFSPSCRREYLEWITGAKRDETRSRRIATAVEQIANGKKMNERYR